MLYLVAEREDLPLDRVLGNYPDCQFERIEAIDIALEAGTFTQQLKYKISRYLIEKGMTTQVVLAKAVECSQSRISQLFKQFGDTFKKLLLVLYNSLNSSNKIPPTPSLLIDWERYIDPDLVGYVAGGILENAELTEDDRSELVVDLAVGLTCRQFEALKIELGKGLGAKLVSLLEFGVAKIPISIFDDVG